MIKQKKRLILLVDDEELWLEAAKRIVKESGFRAITASSGEEALKAISKQVPDIVIADVRMPVMNGFDLYQKVRENPKWQKLPIFFMSAIDDFDAKRVARDLGASGYIPKPFHTEDLQDAMSGLLKKL